jgi:hypothetical protein
MIATAMLWTFRLLLRGYLVVNYFDESRERRKNRRLAGRSASLLIR